VIVNPYIGFALLVFAPQLFLAILYEFDWNHGEIRGAIVLALLAALLVFRFGPKLAFRRSEGPTPKWIYALMAAAAMFVALDCGRTIARTLATGHIPMDEGQTTWRAARLLWHGENPYGAGALTDMGAIAARTDARREAGMAPAPEGAALVSALAAYDKTLDPALREQILPTPTTGAWVGAAAREARLGGYKYGPAILLLTAPFGALGAPTIVVILNQALCLGLFWAMWRLMRGVAGAAGFAALGVTALLIDQHIVWNFIDGTATDVWPLLWGALAVLAYRAERPYLVAAALALAAGGKIFPSLMFTPLLLTFRSVKPIAAFVGLLGLIYLPFLIADPMGLIDNVFMWPLLMFKDTTSWQYYAPPLAGLLVRAAALVGMAALWLAYLAGRETRLFWTLATLHAILLLTPGAFHNNYVPWVSIWVVAALVESTGLAVAPKRGAFAALAPSL
jgi:hypothetical protein